MARLDRNRAKLAALAERFQSSHLCQTPAGVARRWLPGSSSALPAARTKLQHVLQGVNAPTNNARALRTQPSPRNAFPHEGAFMFEQSMAVEWNILPESEVMFTDTGVR